MSAEAWLVVGHPTNRRVQMFRAAAEGLGVAVDTVSWRELLDDISVLGARPRTLRIESPGEDEEVARRFRVLGGGPDRVARPGEVLEPATTHRGFLMVLARIERWVHEHPGIVLQQPLETIRTCFDKRACHALLQSAGVPVPPSVAERDVEALIDRAAAGPALWVKLASGSSASGLGRLSQHAFMTTLRAVDDRWFNAFRVQRTTGARRRRALAWLIEQGVHIEEEVPRARLDGAFFDLRLLVVEGEPRFVIVRQARHPITNLHLGGWRGSVDALFAAMGEQGRERLNALGRAVGRALPHGHLGVDVAVGRDFRTLTVLEVNAFGDLLPRLSMDGLDTYGVEIASRLPNHAGRMLVSP